MAAHRRHARHMLVGWALLCLSLIAACALGTPTQIFVHVDADPLTRTRSVFLRATITSQEGEVRLQHEFPLLGDTQHSWPIDLSILPRGGDASRRVSVKVEALDATRQVFNERTGLYSFLPDTLLETTILLQDACIGVVCAEGLTCDFGACVLIASIDQERDADAQVGACQGGACWEHPRPAGAGASAVCAFQDGTESGGVALVIGGTVAWLEGDTWMPEEVWPDARPRHLDCWGPHAAVAINDRRVAVTDSAAAGWTDLPLPEGTRGLRAVWAKDASEIWVVGAGGLVLRHTRAGWAVPPGLGALDTDLHQVSEDDGDVLIIGTDVAIRYSRDASAPTPIVLPTNHTGSLSYASRGGHAAHTDTMRDLRVFEQGTWSDVYRGTSGYGFTALVYGGDRLYVGGGRGSVEWRENDTWSSAPEFGGAAINELASVHPSVVYAVGDNATIGALRNGRWDHGLVRISYAALHSVAADDSNPLRALAVGEDATILERVDEAIWRRRAVLNTDGTQLDDDLNAVVIHDAHAWAAGEGGLILHSSDGIVWDVTRQGTGRWHVLCAQDDQVLVAGETGALVHTTEWSSVTSTGGFDSSIHSCVAIGGGAWLVGDENGNVHRIEGLNSDRVASYPGNITALRRGDTALAVVAGGSIYVARPDGRCDAPCDAGPHQSAQDVVLDGDAVSWWRNGNEVHHPTSSRVTAGFDVDSAFTPFAGGVLAVGPRGAIIYVSR